MVLSSVSQQIQLLTGGVGKVVFGQVIIGLSVAKMFDNVEVNGEKPVNLLVISIYRELIKEMIGEF